MSPTPPGVLAETQLVPPPCSSLKGLEGLLWARGPETVMLHYALAGLGEAQGAKEANVLYG